MHAEIQQRIINHASLTASDDQAMLKLEVGIFPDQIYEKFVDKMTCNEKRSVAMKVVSIETPIDGEWSAQNITFVSS